MALSKADAIAELKRRKRMSDKLSAYVPKVFQTIEPGKEYLDNWHIGFICEYLEAVYLGQIQRLLINIQPRSLKSIIVNVAFPTWVLGKAPTKEIMSTSYADTLSLGLNVDCRSVMQSLWYEALFPNSLLKPGQTEKRQFHTIAGGSKVARTVGGSTMGTGFDFGIIDDPIKFKDAHSEAVRDSTNRWLEHEFLTRKNDPKQSAVIAIMQRLAVGDPTDHLLKLDDWEHVKIPTEAPVKKTYSFGEVKKTVKPGELLQPDRLGPDEVIKLKKSEYLWSSQYQQEPFPIGGALFKQDWWRTYRDIPRFRIRVIQVWDTAFKEKETNDYSACETWLESDMGYHLLDAYRDRFNYPNLIKQMKAQYAKHNPDVVIVEDKASGQSAVQTLQAETKMPILARPAERDLIARASTVSAAVEAGNCFIPEYAEWLADWLGEHNAFPGAPHDDWVSCTILFLEFVKQAIGDYAEEFDIGESVVSGYDGDSY